MSEIVIQLLVSMAANALTDGAKLSFRRLIPEYAQQTINKDKVDELIHKLDSIENLSQKIEALSKMLRDDDILLQDLSSSLYKTEFAKRLDYIMMLMNKSRKNSIVNVFTLGQYLGHDSANELLQYYKFDNEPDFSYSTLIANKLGVFPDWLISGRKAPFLSIHDDIWSVNDLLCKPEFNDINEYIFFVKRCEDVRNRELGIIIKYNSIKYTYYPTILPFSSNVGATGAHRLRSLCVLMDKLTQNTTKEYSAYYVDEGYFYDILEGKEYPGSITIKEKKLWLVQDFAKSNHYYQNDDYYIEAYGEDFLEMLAICKS